MNNYINNIKNSKLTIYDYIDPTNKDLYIPTKELEKILSNTLVGTSFAGIPLRTRSKVVKMKICESLGYPIPNSFLRVQPRFIGQNFDVYVQKSFNFQVWNEEIDINRRYVFLRQNEYDIITSVKVISGIKLREYNNSGTLTIKYQAIMRPYNYNICSNYDSVKIQNWIIDLNNTKILDNPNSFPTRNNLLKIEEVFFRLKPMLGKSISYINAIQERNRGNELHKMICHYLGYSIFKDNGNYPDILNQLIEVKLQTSSTIDLGENSPLDNKPLIEVDGVSFCSQDVRYAIFKGIVQNNSSILLQNLYLVTGEDFTNYFPLSKGNGINSKIQIKLPYNFFDN